MSAIKPIKRSKQLAPLSREHRDALLLAWKIRKGLKNGTPDAEIGSYVHWYWNNFMQRHFRQEEELLLPHLPVTNEMVRRLKKEHESIQAGIEGSLDHFSLAALAGIIYDHIRFEERHLFPFIEQHVGLKVLDTIQSKLDQQMVCNEKWENEFWVK